MYDKVFALGGSAYTEMLGKTPEIAAAFKTHSPVAVVVGAGNLKKYINAVDASEAEKDVIGIQATRLNAKTLATEMEASAQIPENTEEILAASQRGEDIVLGGLNPGFSTDAVAALTAELLDADLMIATDVDGVYDRDPGKPDAERLEQASIDELRSIIGEKSSDAGSYRLIDNTALNILERSGIEAKMFKASVSSLEVPSEARGTVINGS